MSQTPGSARDDERRLVKLYRSLAPEDRHLLLAFGEFLVSRGATNGAETQGALKPERIARPQVETVVGAIKRLSRSYFMLDRSAMLNDTSSLMGAHVLQGRPTSQVIDELEILFAQHYEKYRKGKEHEET
jgi:hypothetical protein